MTCMRTFFDVELFFEIEFFIFEVVFLKNFELAFYISEVELFQFITESKGPCTAKKMW